MPIRPENRALYPKNWKSEVVPRIRARSGNRCECTGQCGHAHVQDDNNPLRCHRWNGDPINLGEAKPFIVLTVAHLNHQPEDCRDENLLHMCQGCHLRYDAPRKQREMKERRRAQCAVGDMFECVETQGGTQP